MRFRPAFLVLGWSALATALAFSLTAWPARASGDKGDKVDKADATPEFLSIRLRNTDATKTAAALQKIFDRDEIRFVGDTQSNSLLIRCTPAQFREIEAVIERLDTTPPADAGPPATKITILPLRSLEANATLEKSLRLAFPESKTGNFAIDPVSKTLILVADPVTTERVSSLLDRLIAAKTNRVDDAQVRIVWLVSGMDQKNAAEVPDDLKGMLPGLAKLGLPRPQMAAQFVVNTQPNSQFRATGTARLREIPCHLSVAGRLNNSKGQARLEIRIQATRDSAPKEEICDLQTEINAPPGHLVALGVTPSENLTSAFVVQILSTEPGKTAPQK